MTSRIVTPPHSIRWVEARLDVRAYFDLRNALRHVERSLDARLVLLWAVERHVDTRVLEYAGDNDVLPRELPRLDCSVPSREAVVDKHRETHDAVVQRIRLGGEAPRLGVVIVDPRDVDNSVLFDAVEAVGERIEGIIVESAERVEFGSPGRRVAT